MTRQSAIDQAVRRGFRKLYESPSACRDVLRHIAHDGDINPSEHKAVLMAWDRVAQIADERAA